MNALEELIGHLSRLPGIGRKSATRIAYYLLRSDSSLSANLSQSLLRTRERIHPCPNCGNYTEIDPCSVCADTTRDVSTICVVEQPQDVAVLEATREYRGLYHVLMGVISPIEGVGPKDLTVARLVERLRNPAVTELILATNPTVEGDTTALYLVKLFEGSHVKTSRLALGLPVGGDLEYADRLTIARSLRGRTTLSS
ncbi:MAG TPA: recombination mediator RecR [Spirochaetia bacterium]|nr:recombination mediator RecR [Spirochaetia bacterium]